MFPCWTVAPPPPLPPPPLPEWRYSFLQNGRKSRGSTQPAPGPKAQRGVALRTQSLLEPSPWVWALVPFPLPGLTSSSRATVIKMAQPHIPARPRRWRVRRPARSTKSTCKESQGLAGAFRMESGREWGGLGGWTQPRGGEPVVGPLQRPAVTEIKVKTVLTTPAPMVAYAGCPTPADSKMLVE